MAAPSLETLTDEELLERDRSGDSAAFDVLVDRHGRTVFAFALRWSGDRALAEDILQETYLKAFRARKEWRADARFSTWLLTIARNLLTDRFRWLRRWKLVSLEKAGEPTPPPLRLLRDDPEQAVLRKETHEELRQAVGRLPEQLREVLLLSRYGGMSYAEIAAATGTTEAAIKQRAYRGMLMLREMLAPAAASKEKTHASLRRPGT